MTEFRLIPFSKFVTLQRGFDLPKKDRLHGPYPVVASTSVHGTHAAYKVEAPGVTTGRSGSLGTVLFIQQPFWPLNTTLWVKDFRDNCPRYAYYLMQTLGLEHYNAGAGVPTLNRNHLDDIQVLVPNRDVQERIASVLAAYDELIENNLRRIQILEELAQAVYREWLVHMRFPGNEGVPLVDSPLGPIPEGWEVTDLCAVASVNSESIRPKEAPLEIRYIDISSVSPGSIDTVTTMALEDAPSRARRVVRSGDTIWSTVRPNRRSYALVLNPEANTIASTGFAVLRPTTVPWVFLHLVVSTREFSSYLANHAQGAAYPAVNIEDFQNARIIVPQDCLLDLFIPLVEPMFELRERLRKQNDNLRVTRDLLLPKLVSGQIDVSEMDIDTVLLAL